MTIEERILRARTILNLFGDSHQNDVENVTDIIADLFHLLKKEDPARAVLHSAENALRHVVEEREAEEEADTTFPMGAASCPVCGACHLDSDHAGACCEDARR